MPFDGEKFDTTAIQQLTFSGENYYPSWSPDGRWIAYDNVSCGNSSAPPAPNSCGILTMTSSGANNKLVARGRYPDWINNDLLVYAGYPNQVYKIQIADSVVTRMTTLNQDNYSPKFSQSKNLIAWLSQNGSVEIWTMDRNAKNQKKVESGSTIGFSFAPDGRIVFVRFNHTRIDGTSGTLWIMNADGGSQIPLTFNNAIVSVD